LPERDISSLGVMGWGLEAAGKFFRRRTVGGGRWGGVGGMGEIAEINNTYRNTSTKHMFGKK